MILKLFFVWFWTVSGRNSPNPEHCYVIRSEDAHMRGAAFRGCGIHPHHVTEAYRFPHTRSSTKADLQMSEALKAVCGKQEMIYPLSRGARLVSSACVEVDSDTEAVAGKEFKLGCISCKLRGEVDASATVDWWFMARGESEFTHIYSYADMTGEVMDDRFTGRVEWAGSKNTLDLQDGTLNILNVTYNDTGTYRCYFDRTLSFTFYEYRTNATKFITINVVAKETRGMASILSEVMMYVSIIGLQLWLLVEMVYCYRKIAAAGEEALRESAAEYLAITSESKDNCTGVAVAE